MQIWLCFSAEYWAVPWVCCWIDVHTYMHATGTLKTCTLPSHRSSLHACHDTSHWCNTNAQSIVIPLSSMMHICWLTLTGCKPDTTTSNKRVGEPSNLDSGGDGDGEENVSPPLLLSILQACMPTSSFYILMCDWGVAMVTCQLAVREILVSTLTAFEYILVCQHNSCLHLLIWSRL